jgi:hypothetical protein
MSYLARRLIPVLLCLWPLFAHAQSVPGPTINPNANCTTTGSNACTVWTPAQWIAAWEAKADVASGNFISPTMSNPVFSGVVSGGYPWNVGSSIYPVIGPTETTTATTTNTSPNITVTNAAGLAVGQYVNAAFVTGCSTVNTSATNPYIVSMVGTAVVMSCPATATHVTPVAVTFGTTLFNTTSHISVNSVATEFLIAGEAANGSASDWISQVVEGGYGPTPQQAAAIITVAANAQFGLIVGGHTAATPAPLLGLTCLYYADTWNNGSPLAGECIYEQSNLLAATAGSTVMIQHEQSINNLWPVVSENPYSTNQINQTVDHRYTCGTGQSSGPFPNNCTVAIDILPNGASWEDGIVIGAGAMDTASSRIAPVLSMPSNTGIFWYTSNSTASVSMYGDTAGNLNETILGNLNFNVSGVLKINTVSAVTCPPGNPSSSFAVNDGFVVHC